MQFRKSVHLHVAAVGTGTVVGRAGDEVLIRGFLTEAVEHATFGDDDDVFHRGFLAVGDHLFGRANFVCEQSNSLSAFRVSDDKGVGVFGFDFVDRLASELDVDVTVAFPEIHFATGLLHDPSAEIFVGDEEDGSVGGGLVDNLDGVSGGANNVTEGLHVGRAVDVGNDVVVLVGVLLEEGFEFGAGAALFERAASVRVGQDNGFRGVHDFRRFGHEMDAAEADHIGFSVFGLVGETEGVTDIVRDVLDIAGLVVVGENDGVLLHFKLENRFFEIERGAGHAENVGR